MSNVTKVDFVKKAVVEEVEKAIVKKADNVIVENAGKVTVKPNVIKEVRPPEPGSISPGQWAELKDKLNIWVSTSELAGKPVSYQAATAMLHRQAKSAGRKGVTRWADYPEEDLKKGIGYLNGKIKELRDLPDYKRNDPEGSRNALYTAINTKRKQNKISETNYRAYMQSKYGANSLKDLEMHELEEFRNYLFGGGRCVTARPKAPSVQELREQALRKLIDVYRFDANAIPASKNEVWGMLQENNEALFTISSDTFEKFWKVQKVCKLKPGRRSSSQESPNTLD